MAVLAAVPPSGSLIPFRLLLRYAPPFSLSLIFGLLALCLPVFPAGSASRPAGQGVAFALVAVGVGGLEILRIAAHDPDKIIRYGAACPALAKLLHSCPGGLLGIGSPGDLMINVNRARYGGAAYGTIAASPPITAFRTPGTNAGRLPSQGMPGARATRPPVAFSMRRFALR